MKGLLACYFIKWQSGGRLQVFKHGARACVCIQMPNETVTELAGGYLVVHFARKYSLVLYRNLSHYVVIFNANCNITCTCKWLPVRKSRLDWLCSSELVLNSSCIPYAFIVVPYGSTAYVRPRWPNSRSRPHIGFYQNVFAASVRSVDLRLTAFFESTYFCKEVFSQTNIIKSRYFSGHHHVVNLQLHKRNC
jgi:hypothetical protein